MPPTCWQASSRVEQLRVLHTVDDEKLCCLVWEEISIAPQVYKLRYFSRKWAWKVFLLPFTTIKKSYAEMVFVAWPRALSWEEQKIIDLFQGNNTKMFLTPLLLYLPDFTWYFPRMSWPFLRAPTSQLSESTIEFRRAVSGLDG